MLSVMKETVNFRPALVPQNGRLTDCTRVMDAFGVAYLIWYPGGQAQLSDAAMRLLQEGNVRTSITAQATALARNALQVATLRLGTPDGFAFDSQVRATGSALELAVFASRAEREECALVVLLPAKPAGLGGFSGRGLTPREHDVALLIAEGHATKDISAKLGISPRTASHHTEQVFRKLGVTSRCMLAAMANRVVDPPRRQVSEATHGRRDQAAAR